MVTSFAGGARLVVGALVGLLVAAACGSADDSGLRGSSTDAASEGGGRGGQGGTGKGGSAGQAGGSAGRDGSTSCTTDTDCSPGVCDPLSKSCVPCLFDSDCGTNQRCTDKQCGPLGECTNSLDCVSVPNKPVCDTARKRCEECLQSVDCPGTADCIASRCRPYTRCVNSLDCTSGVCDTAASRCVGCLSDADCGGSASGKKCVNKTCVEQVTCQSDVQCTPLGMLCDTTRGVCVRCTRHADCPEVYHCSEGNCAIDVCRQGEARCQGNAIARCNAVGDGVDAPAPCAAKQSCVAQGTGATCRDWVCDAGLKYCQGTEAIECSADGFQILSRTDCSQSALVCSSGTCKSQLCTPNQTFCDGVVVKRCDATGQNATVVATCTATQYCDTAAPACRPQVCSPGQPACNLDVATTCNATGSGYQPGGTNCAQLGQSCSNGICQNCPAGAGAVQSVRLVEIFIGGADYAVIENRHATCPAQLGGMQFQAHINDGGASDLNFTLPTRSLAPGARVFIAESAAAQTGDIVTSANISWAGSATGGWALLCTGACTTTPTSNVIDAFSFNGGGVPPAFPSPVVFSPTAMTGITTTENTQAYKRTAFTGAYPTFRASDWSVGAATRPYSSGSCPAAQPVNGSSCSAIGAVCNYGTLSCTCLLTWSCV